MLECGSTGRANPSPTPGPNLGLTGYLPRPLVHGPSTTPGNSCPWGNAHADCGAGNSGVLHWEEEQDPAITVESPWLMDFLPFSWGVRPEEGQSVFFWSAGSKAGALLTSA